MKIIFPFELSMVFFTWVGYATRLPLFSSIAWIMSLVVDLLALFPVDVAIVAFYFLCLWICIVISSRLPSHEGLFPDGVDVTLTPYERCHRPRPGCPRIGQIHDDPYYVDYDSPPPPPSPPPNVPPEDDPPPSQLQRRAEAKTGRKLTQVEQLRAEANRQEALRIQRDRKEEESKGILQTILTLFGIIGPLRPFQEDAIQYVRDGHDVMVLADTGLGKSLIFQSLPGILQGIGLVISPLKALVRNQMRTLPKGVTAVHLEKASDITDLVRQGGYSLVYIAPELLKDTAFVSLVKSSVYQGRLRFVAIDEVDCIAWKTFRDAWNADAIGRFRGLLRENLPFVALTATMPEWHFLRMKKQLHMSTCKLVRANLPRDNLFFEVRTRGKSWSAVCRDILDPIVAELLELGDQVCVLFVACVSVCLRTRPFRSGMLSRAHMVSALAFCCTLTIVSCVCTRERTGISWINWAKAQVYRHVWFL